MHVVWLSPELITLLVTFSRRRYNGNKTVNSISIPVVQILTTLSISSAMMVWHHSSCNSLFNDYYFIRHRSLFSEAISVILRFKSEDIVLKTRKKPLNITHVLFFVINEQSIENWCCVMLKKGRVADKSSVLSSRIIWVHLFILNLFPLRSRQCLSNSVKIWRHYYLLADLCYRNIQDLWMLS